MAEPGTAAARCRLFLIVLSGALALAGCGGEEDEAQAGDDAGNTAPALSGTPPTSVAAGSEYAFKPQASDPDGDPLLFAIDVRPPSAEVDPLTGALTRPPYTQAT